MAETVIAYGPRLVTTPCPHKTSPKRTCQSTNRILGVQNGTGDRHAEYDGGSDVSTLSLRSGDRVRCGMMKLVWIGVAVCVLVMVLRVVDAERINNPMPVKEVAPVAATVEHQDSDKAAADRQTLLDAQADADEQKAAVNAKLAKEFPDYEKTVGKAAQKIGTANALAQCNLRSADWYGRTNARLQTALNATYFDLPQEDRHDAEVYANKQAMDVWKSWIRTGCAQIATMPFVASDDFLTR